MLKELICISCSMGCRIKVDKESRKVFGNSCPKGADYGINEVFNPVRVITSVVKVANGDLSVLPVKTNGAIPKNFNFACINEINKVTINAPVKVGDIIIKNVLNTGIDIVATRDIAATKC